jgi:hypothetical protein
MKGAARFKHPGAKDGSQAPGNFALSGAASHTQDVEARAVGGPAAALFVALLACDVSPPRVPLAGEAGEIKTDEAEPQPPVSVPTVAAAAAPAPSSRVVLVTIDGARWEDVAPEEPDTRSAMPTLSRLVAERGILLGGAGCENDVRASGPNFVSLPGYVEMFTGQPTSCTNNGCPPVRADTVLDEVRAGSHRAGDVAVFASWNRYANAVARDRSGIVLSAGARATTLGAAKDDGVLRGMLEGGLTHAGYPGWGDYRPDVHTAKVALRYLETVGPRLLVVGLGDADEYAHRGDFVGYRRALRRADDFVGDLDRTLARMGDDGARTSVVVTTDHGRAHTLRSHGALFPESQRVFVAAFGAKIAHRGPACAASPLHLADLAGAVRGLLAASAPPTPLTRELISAVDLDSKPTADR